MNIDWKTNRELGTLGRERGIAVPVEMGSYAKDIAKSAPIEGEEAMAQFVDKLPVVLGSIAVLRGTKHLPSLFNLARTNFTSISTIEKRLFATTRTGLTVPSAVLVRPFNEVGYAEPGTEVHVRRNDLGRVSYLFNLTEEGETFLRVHEAVVAERLWEAEAGANDPN